jgi:hypothetical protein
MRMRIPDLVNSGSETEKIGSGILDKLPGFATLQGTQPRKENKMQEADAFYAVISSGSTSPTPSTFVPLHPLGYNERTHAVPLFNPTLKLALTPVQDL